MDDEEFDSLSEEVDKYKRERDRLLGARDALKERLLSEFGKKTTKGARVLHHQLMEQEEEKKQEIEDELRTFRAAYSEKLPGRDKRKAGSKGSVA